MDTVEIPDRHKLDAVITSVSFINAKLKEFDQQVGLSKAYISKSLIGATMRPNQGRVSPVDGESDIRLKMRDSEGGGSASRRAAAKSTSSKSSNDGTRFLSMNDKMED